MVANPPETRIPLTAAGWFLRCRPALNPQKDVFSIRLRSLALEDHILSQNLLVDVGADTFAGKKTAFGGVNPLDLPLILLTLVLSAFSQ
jgi:hypothetical protein